MSTVGYCLLSVGELLLGVSVADLEEILLDPVVTPVPLAPPGVLGLINRRGEILAVHDGHARFDVESAAGFRPSVHAILTLDGETVSLAVDAEADVVELDDSTLQPVPETVSLRLRRQLDGLAELPDGRLVAMLRAAPSEVAACA